MRTQLLGLPLKQAEAILSEEGVHPQVSETYAPRREKRDGGKLRVVYASDDGKKLVAARFLDPISDPQPSTDRHGGCRRSGALRGPPFGLKQK